MNFRASKFAQIRAAIPHYPGIAVLIGPDAVLYAHVGEHLLEKLHRVRVVGIFKVVVNTVNKHIGFRVFHFQSWHEQGALASCVDGECDRTLGGNERESGEIQDVAVIEKHDAA